MDDQVPEDLQDQQETKDFKERAVALESQDHKVIEESEDTLELKDHQGQQERLE
jgi:hypothetical protein